LINPSFSREDAADGLLRWFHPTLPPSPLKLTRGIAIVQEVAPTDQPQARSSVKPIYRSTFSFHDIVFARDTSAIRSRLIIEFH
jgi:hypothetical protein